MAGIILAVAAINFVSFTAIATVIGGDALGATDDLRRDGHYYLRYKGEVTEVSKRVWFYSRIHGFSVYATHVLGLLTIWMLVRPSTRPTPAA